MSNACFCYRYHELAYDNAAITLRCSENVKQRKYTNILVFYSNYLNWFDHKTQMQPKCQNERKRKAWNVFFLHIDDISISCLVRVFNNLEAVELWKPEFTTYLI